MKKILYLALFAVCFFSACKQEKAGWGVSGEITGDKDYTVIIEAYNNGLWYTVDSLTTEKGNFEYISSEPVSYPQIMRLNLNGKYIYFPVDSIDRISVRTSGDSFSEGYDLDGTLSARTFKSIDSLVNNSIAKIGVDATIANVGLRRDLYNTACIDTTVISRYYLINKTVGDKQLFDINNPQDLRFYKAIAQLFQTQRPDDSRTQALINLVNSRRKSSDGQIREIAVPEVAIFDINRKDERGVSHSLVDMASKGDVVALSFTAYGIEASPAYNILLNSLYEKYADQGFKIYQVGFDGDEAFWKETARNLPWTTVWNSSVDDPMILVNYNVGELPTTFLIDRSGSIAARVSDPAELEKELKKVL